MSGCPCRPRVADDLPALTPERQAEFAAAFAASPWPMLMLSPDGALLAVSDHDDVGAAALLHRAPQYLSCLRGAVPWQTPQEAWCERARPDGSAVCERLVLRCTPWGASLSIVPAAEPGPTPTTDPQTARLAAIGFMIAGVCHEVANPLTSLQSIVQILQADAQRTPGLLDKGLRNIATNVHRVLEISRRLVTFARVGDEPRARFAVDDAVDEALVVLREEGLLQGIVLERTTDARARVTGSLGQAREVFLNLLVNAAHVMPGGGRLRIVTVSQDGQVCVDVSDTGPGVPAAARDRLFEPFFTTKPDGRGTGLGLAISREITIEHGGSLELLDTRPPGATFRVTLPQAGAGSGP